MTASYGRCACGRILIEPYPDGLVVCYDCREKERPSRRVLETITAYGALKADVERKKAMNLRERSEFEISVLEEIKAARYAADAHSQFDKQIQKDTAITVRSSPGKPTMFVAEIQGRAVGRLSITVLPLVHDMEIEPGLLQRKIANMLFQYASGYVKASGFNEAIVLVAEDNEPMQRYVEARSVPEESSRVYLMEVS